jgi:hypothetical protein
MRKIHDFLGFGRVPSSCIIHVIETDKARLIMFQNTGIGTSVTNASEQLASEIINELKANPNLCRFFETYPENDMSIDEITYEWYLHRDTGIYEAMYPNWHPSVEEHIIKLLLQKE